MPTETDDRRTKLTPEELDALMPDGEYVHTFISGAMNILIGADWKRTEILKCAEAHGAELSGDMATSMNHGALVWDRKQPVFVETKKKGTE